MCHESILVGRLANILAPLTAIDRCLWTVSVCVCHLDNVIDPCRLRSHSPVVNPIKLQQKLLPPCYSHGLRLNTGALLSSLVHHGIGGFPEQHMHHQRAVQLHHPSGQKMKTGGKQPHTNFQLYQDEDG